MPSAGEPRRDNRPADSLMYLPLFASIGVYSRFYFRVPSSALRVRVRKAIEGYRRLMKPIEGIFSPSCSCSSSPGPAPCPRVNSVVNPLLHLDPISFHFCYGLAPSFGPMFTGLVTGVAGVTGFQKGGWGSLSFLLLLLPMNLIPGRVGRDSVKPWFSCLLGRWLDGVSSYRRGTSAHRLSARECPFENPLSCVSRISWWSNLNLLRDLLRRSSAPTHLPFVVFVSFCKSLVRVPRSSVLLLFSLPPSALSL